MTSANLDLVRSIYAAWARGDWSSVEWAHPDIEYVRADGPAPGSWTGVAGMEYGFRDYLSAWEGYRFEADEYRELDHDPSSCSAIRADAARRADWQFEPKRVRVKREA